MSVSEVESGGLPQPPYPLHPSVAERIDAEYASFYERHIKSQQQVHLQPIEKSRASGTLIPGAGEPRPVAASRDLSIDRVASSGPLVPIRIFTPVGDAPAGGWPLCFWFHGGGWVLGTIDTENVIATNFCDRGRCVVICVDYR
jgi:acetyl esterase/lipase